MRQASGRHGHGPVDKMRTIDVPTQESPMSSTDAPKKRKGILGSGFEPFTITEGVHLVATQGNGVVVETAKGLVLVDAGPGSEVTDSMISDVHDVADGLVHAIVYSHGHVGYNAGVPQWQADAEARGDEPPKLVGHRNVVERYRRY